MKRILLWVAIVVGAHGGATAGARPGTATMLFFDDEPLYSRDHVIRQLGIPQRVGAYHEPGRNFAFSYPGVFRLADGSWRMVYQTGAKGMPSDQGLVLLAESRDGLDWKPCDTRDQLDLPDRAAPHQIIPHLDGLEMSGTFEDLNAGPAARYKLLAIGADAAHSGRQSLFWTSPDLVHWTRQSQVVWQVQPWVPDPPVFAYWDPVHQSYALTIRPEDGDRRIGLSETRDWKSFSRRELALETDADDPALAQLYGMSVVPYEGYFVGLLWLYYAGDASSVNGAPHRYLGGRTETYLAYSLNGRVWQRCFHRPLFPNGGPGAPDAGCLRVSSVVPLSDGTLRCYACASELGHAMRSPDDGFVTIYNLRRDGWVCLEAGSEPGLVGTRALYWRGGDASLNVDATGGEVRVRVVTARNESLAGYGFADCAGFSGDRTDWTPRWAGGRSLADLAGRMVRIEIQMSRAKLYALRGDFIIARAQEVNRFERNGVVPTPEAGLGP
jgi:hypothetical protein